MTPTLQPRTPTAVCHQPWIQVSVVDGAPGTPCTLPATPSTETITPPGAQGTPGTPAMRTPCSTPETPPGDAFSSPCTLPGTPRCVLSVSDGALVALCGSPLAQDAPMTPGGAPGTPVAAWPAPMTPDLECGMQDSPVSLPGTLMNHDSFGMEAGIPPGFASSASYTPTGAPPGTPTGFETGAEACMTSRSRTPSPSRQLSGRSTRLSLATANHVDNRSRSRSPVGDGRGRQELSRLGRRGEQDHSQNPWFGDHRLDSGWGSSSGSTGGREDDAHSLKDGEYWVLSAEALRSAADPEQLARLVSIGVSESSARQALEVCGNNISRAIECAFGQGADQAAKTIKVVQEKRQDMENITSMLESRCVDGLTEDVEVSLRLALHDVSQASRDLDAVVIDNHDALQTVRNMEGSRCHELEKKIMALLAPGASRTATSSASSGSSDESTKAPSQSIGRCVVCMVAPAEYAAVPCGHQSFCSSCRGGVEKCPVCRERIQMTLRIFMAGVQ